MVKTVLSDDASEESLLRDHLMSQQAEQAKVNQTILKQFESLGKGNKIDDKGADMMTKLVIAQTSVSFPPSPAESTDTTMGEWINSNHSILSAAPWDIDGVSIVNMEGVVLADASKHYRARSTKLGMIMRQLLTDAKLTDSIKSLKATIETNDGVLLIENIFEHLLPLATTRVLDVLTEIGHCMQKNGESVDHFASQMENLFLQIKKLGYKSVKDLKLAYCQRRILQGAYHKHKSLYFFTKKLQNAELDLKSWDSPHAFHKYVSQIFTNQKVYKDGEMNTLSAHQVGEA